MMTIRTLAVAAAMVVASGTVDARGYPERTITFVVPFAAGGATDLLGRQFAERMSRGQPAIVIENVPGAGGTVGANKVAKAKPDGYTFLVGHVGYMAAAAGLYKQLPYDPIQDFEPVARFPDTPLVLVCNRDKPYSTEIGRLIDFSRKNPGTVTMANAGVGSSGHLVAALVAGELKLDVTHVPYKGNAPALTDIIGGRVDCLFDQSNTAMPQVKGGKVAGVVTTSATRLPQMPQIPTLAESGLPGFQSATWYGIFAPRGTPREALQWVFERFRDAMNDSAFAASLVEAGYVMLRPEEQRPEALGAHTRQQVQLWKKVIADAAIPPQ